MEIAEGLLPRDHDFYGVESHLNGLSIRYASELIDAFMVEDDKCTIGVDVHRHATPNHQGFRVIDSKPLSVDQFDRERTERHTATESLQFFLKGVCFHRIVHLILPTPTYPSLPPPCEELTTKLPFFIATRVRPPGMIVIFSP